MKKLTLCALVASTLLAGNAMAKEDAINPWKQCGIGAKIFDDNGTAAALSNVIWDLGTTAVSSNISSKESCNGKEVKTAQFIQDNYDQVVEETSQGAGTHLTAMLNMLEVEQSQQPQILKAIRAEVADQVVAKKATPESYYNVVIASL
ncbi:DUF3015 family protein [Marinagarivorans algicola]|uniref:DUF3015 family protein n=1 Tax=Marinagarivorans algicola TaxID=1513270 RepID=UPI0006B4A232|nr:DUF3015 family protein [Marinagarivorans algicola]